jgi:hypothetical protein
MISILCLKIIKRKGPQWCPFCSGTARTARHVAQNRSPSQPKEQNWHASKNEGVRPEDRRQ